MAKNINIKIPTFPRTTAVLGDVKDSVASHVPIKVVRNQERLERRQIRKLQKAQAKDDLKRMTEQNMANANN